MKKISWERARKIKDFGRIHYFYIFEFAEVFDIFYLGNERYLVSKFFQHEKLRMNKLQYWLCNGKEDLLKCVRKERPLIAINMYGTWNVEIFEFEKYEKWVKAGRPRRDKYDVNLPNPFLENRHLKMWLRKSNEEI